MISGPRSRSINLRSTAARLIAATAVACLLATPWAAPAAAATSQQDTVLFSLTGSVASMKLTPGSSDTYRFVMKRTDDNAIWFADRPALDSGMIATTAFIGNWATYGFTKTPPNISITLHTAIGKTSSLVAIMRKPSYDPTTHTLTATMKVLGKESARPVPERLGAVSLFIDSATIEWFWSCIDSTGHLITPPVQYAGNPASSSWNAQCDAARGTPSLSAPGDTPEMPPPPPPDPEPPLPSVPPPT